MKFIIYHTFSLVWSAGTNHIINERFFYTNYSSYTHYNCIKNGPNKLPEEHANFEEFTFEI